jgi:hypothetical protein
LEGGEAAAPSDPTKQSGIVRKGGTGDGGASWRLKALRRAQMAAEEEGKDVREVRKQHAIPSHNITNIRNIWEVCREHYS